MKPEKIIEMAKGRGVDLTTDGEKLQYKGPENAFTSDFVDTLKTHKTEIIRALLSDCDKCKAAGYWDYGDYAGKLLCFHYAVFECRSGKPKPCIEARENCPKTAGKKFSNGTNNGTT